MSNVPPGRCLIVFFKKTDQDYKKKDNSMEIYYLVYFTVLLFIDMIGITLGHSPYT